MMENSTIAAIATPPGQGGIAVVRLSGPESYAVAEKVFRPADSRKRVADAKGYTALYGTFVHGGETFDDGVALFYRSPRSYTGEDVVELSCHGGDAVARRLVEACLAAGAVPAGPGEYTRRALLNGKLSLTQAEAVMDLISAGGRQGAALANAARDGALARKISAQQQILTDLQAHLTAWVDFPEEDVPALETDTLRASLEEVKAGLDELIENYNAAAVLREGVDCAIVGRPNAGKSTLLNRLTGAESYVQDQLFATLDPTARELRLPDGQKAVIIDTVGLIDRLPHDLVEAFHSTLETATEADVILTVCDVSSRYCREELAVTGQVLDDLGCGGIPKITVYNKIDKLPEIPSDFPMEGRPHAYISALYGDGVEKLLEQIAGVLAESVARVTLMIPYSAGHIAGAVRQEGNVTAEEYTPDGILLTATVPRRSLHRYRAYLVDESGKVEV